MFHRRNILVLVLIITLSFFLNYSVAQRLVKDNVQNEGSLFKINSKEKKVRFRGNNFTYSDSKEKKKTDSITSSDRPFVLTMNGNKIYNTNEVKMRHSDSTRYSQFEEYLLGTLSHYPSLMRLADGTASIHLDDIVIDTAGRIVYYNFTTIIYTPANDNKKTLIRNTEKETERMFSKAPHLQPAIISKGKKAIVRLNISMADYNFVIKKHLITYSKNTGGQKSNALIPDKK